MDAKDEEVQSEISSLELVSVIGFGGIRSDACSSQCMQARAGMLPE